MWQIDSSKITNYNPSKGELEALIIFWVLAAGKTAKSAEKILFELIPFMNSKMRMMLNVIYNNQVTLKKIVFG